MSFDDDAAGEGAGFRPPPHPDDRLWRHPSEIVGDRGAVSSRPRPRHHPVRPRWPWGVVAAVGTAGVVAVTLGGALVLGLRGQPGGAEGPGVQASTAIVPSPSPSEPVRRAWLGIEGYDQRAAVQGAAPTTPPTELAPTEGEDGGLDGSDVTVPTETPVDGPPVAGSGEGGSAPDPGTTATSADVPEAGVVVAAVDPDGPAAAALQPGDIVLEVDGEPVEDMATLLAALGDYRPGDQVEITYETSGSGQPGTTMTALVTLAERPAHMGS